MLVTALALFAPVGVAHAYGPVNLATQANVTLVGAEAGDGAGQSVELTGDVNGDGRGDLIIGAPEPQAGAPGLGPARAAYVVFGQPSPTVVDLAALGSNGFQIDGQSTRTTFFDGRDFAGFSVAAPGDVNGDGLADVAVGAQLADNANGADAGSAYVVFGSSSTATVDLGSLGTRGFRIDGAGGTGSAGQEIAAAGDQNLDGRADLLVSDDPRVHVVFGKADNATVDLTATGAGSGHYGITGPAGSLFGFSLANAGDVNADGRPDAVIGCSGCLTDLPPVSSTGAAYVVFGRGGTAAVDATGAPGSDFFRINGGTGWDAGRDVAAAGDQNGDGRADVIVGAQGAQNRRSEASGASFVVYGKATGDPVDLRSTERTAFFKIDGVNESSSSGYPVAGGADLNGDALPDLVVADEGPQFTDGAGAAHVVYGRRPPVDVDLANVGAGGFRIDLPASALIDLSVGGDFNGDGRPDLLGGVPGDAPGRAGAGHGYLLYGLAQPTLAYDPVDVVEDVPMTPAAPRISATGATRYSVDRALPAGLALDPASGVISGTPVDPAAEQTFTVTLADDVGTVSVPLRVRVRERIGACGRIFLGTPARDVLNGTPLGDEINGLAGRDRINGLGGDDCLNGNGGGDTLAGGRGRDQLGGNAGTDVLRGGASRDTMAGDAGADRLSGDAGNDVLAPGGGNDHASGGAGNDSIRGSAGRDRVTGGKGRDSLAAGAGNDTIAAADGVRDTVSCGRGRDRVTADRSDRLRGCERVRRVRPRRS
jgi:hypothetical protein